MLQQVTIHSQAQEAIKPLVEVAIRNQLKSLKHGIRRTKEQLAAFETRFGMSSTEMERQLKSGKMEETLDTIDWRFSSMLPQIYKEIDGIYRSPRYL